MKSLSLLNSSFQRTLILLVLFLILFNGIVFTVYPELSFTALLKSVVFSSSLISGKSTCPKMSIQPAGTSKLGLREALACKPHIPSENACRYAAKAYAPYPSLVDCPELPYELCTVEENKPVSLIDPFPSLKIRCDMSLCDVSKPMYVEVMNPKSGKMMNYAIPIGANDSTVGNIVLKYAKISRASDLNFLFLSCSGLYTRVHISQLITFLPSLPRLENKTQKDKVNVNVFLIDSLSRAHFYRSLPNTVEFLKKANVDSKFPAHIFEYELFQAIHGHTHENEHGLFTGTLYPESIPPKKRSNMPVGLNVLYGVFKQAGYQTMFLDDLCWKSVYGIVSKVRAYNWGTLLSKMKTTNIDTRGITEAACKILREKGQHTLPFFDNREHQLCFNGKHQHEYLTDYIVRYIDAISTSPQRKALFSYTSTHVSHDEIGLRVQGFDKNLKEFIETLSKRGNTISFLFADHGNTYTPYQTKFVEGRQEMYHPVMLVILPKTLARKFGRDVLRNLKSNQRRLFNMFDFRKSLVALAKYDGKSSLDPAGLFGYISKARTCSDLALTEEVICLCKAQKLAKVSIAEQFILSEFAVGKLNNKIQNALLKTRGSVNKSTALFGSCQRLRIQKVESIVRESKSEGLTVTSMDVTVQSGTIVNQEELITVQVESNVTAQTSLKLRLLSFNRISKYGPHKECADQGVPIALCVCNKKLAISDLSAVQEILGVNANITQHPSSSCILDIRRELSNHNTPNARVYEVANICHAKTVNVTITSTNNIRTSTRLPMFVNLPPRTVYFVALLTAQSNEDKLDLKLDISSERNT